MELNGAPAELGQIKALALTNYGHFTSMLVENGRVRGLSQHMQRLARDSHQLFGVDLDTDQVRTYVRQALAAAERRTVVRITVYDPALDLGTIGADASPSVLITTRPAGTGQAGPLRLQAAAYRREAPAVKHIGLFGALQRRRAAQREGYDDVLFLNPDGTISEIATSNIGFIRNDQIVWPRSEWLTGVTMTLLNQVTDEQVVSEALTISDLRNMDAAFATNAATGIRPVRSVDAIEWPTEHEMINKLRELYVDIPGEKI
ncbi:aminotransferase class IV family protein [Amycolatopsis suaedae]|uniref:Aminotransferase n=1 Tax=Amycolatopsis suaedae TaxID=2510978 RepID=A0A4Q7JBS2_9PSEU|nr:aminotransferase class IV family protein [Amycolatopsis suaedae]RZQ64476.1 aminotransferase [Amycolatopsis suaedae]